MKKTSFIALLFFGTIFVAGSAAAQSPAITTYHYDNLRTGWNNNETMLTATSFPSNFQHQHTVLLGLYDQVDAQPLFVPGLTIAGAPHDVVYVATGANNVYAIDASSGASLIPPGGPPPGGVNLGPPVAPLNCGNNGPRVGITGTPVIDLASGTLFVIAYVNGSPPIYQLHALDLATLTDKVTPVTVTASHTAGGTTFHFDATFQRQRAALLLQNGKVYAAFASFCDHRADQSRGWLLGWNWNPSSPTPLTALPANQLDDTQATSTSNFFLSSIWMSGYGIAGDGTDLFFATGNSDCNFYVSPELCPSKSTYDGKTNIQESVVRLSGDLTTIHGIFTPSNVFNLDKADADVGSGGVLLLPAPSSPLLAVQAGKDGNLRLFSSTTSGLTLLNTHPISACWCGPSFFKGPDGVNRVVTSQGSVLHTWHVDLSPAPHLTQSGTSSVTTGQDGGFFTVVSSKSSDGTPYGTPISGTAIIWAVGRPTGSPPTVVLYAFGATSVSGKYPLLFSSPAGSWPNVGGNANIVPVVANGKVYVASAFRPPGGHTMGQLQIFGIGGGTLAPTLASTIETLPSLHAISGTFQKVSGSILTLTTRNGISATIDASKASRNKQIGTPLHVGIPLTVQGSSIDPKTGTLLADSIDRAKGSSALWPPDQ